MILNGIIATSVILQDIMSYQKRSKSFLAITQGSAEVVRDTIMLMVRPMKEGISSVFLSIWVKERQGLLQQGI